MAKKYFKQFTITTIVLFPLTASAVPITEQWTGIISESDSTELGSVGERVTIFKVTYDDDSLISHTSSRINGKVFEVDRTNNNGYSLFTDAIFDYNPILLDYFNNIERYQKDQYGGDTLKSIISQTKGTNIVKEISVHAYKFQIGGNYNPFYMNGGVRISGTKMGFTGEVNYTEPKFIFSNINLGSSTATPIPGSILLLGSGVASLAAYRRRRRK